MNRSIPNRDRNSIRLKDFDYSQNGYYYVTICTKDRECLFGKIDNGKMVLNQAGNVADKCWLEIPKHYPFVILDEFIIMPNHVHGIIVIQHTNVGANNHSPVRFAKNNSSVHGANNNLPLRINGTSGTVGAIVRGFKIGVTKWFHFQMVGANNYSPVHGAKNNQSVQIWQRNYYEHVIRDEEELDRIREYIQTNVLKWNEDSENPENIK